MTVARFAGLEVGQEVAATTYSVSRSDLVRYAGASGDFNPIHWNEDVAQSVGLPGVIAHGMFTMALGSRLVADGCDDPGAVIEYGVRFTKPVPVPDDGAAQVAIVDKVGSVDTAASTVRIDLVASCGGVGVLGRARATVRLP